MVIPIDNTYRGTGGEANERTSGDPTMNAGGIPRTGLSRETVEDMMGTVIEGMTAVVLAYTEWIVVRGMCRMLGEGGV